MNRKLCAQAVFLLFIAFNFVVVDFTLLFFPKKQTIATITTIKRVVKQRKQKTLIDESFIYYLCWSKRIFRSTSTLFSFTLFQIVLLIFVLVINRVKTRNILLLPAMRSSNVNTCCLYAGATLTKCCVSMSVCSCQMSVRRFQSDAI